jgi:hypothetical protein
MLNTTARVIFASALLGFLATPELALATSKKSEQPAASSGEPDQLCRKGIKRSGLPSKLSSVANLSAIRLWTQAAMKHGGNYSMWHNAQSAGVKCEKIENSVYYRCVASGKPCRAVSLDQATAVGQSN